MKFDFRKELGKITPKVAEGAKIYIFCVGRGWEHICKQYKYLVDVNIDDYIDGFIDNDKNKQGTIFHGKPVYDISDISIESSIIIVATGVSKIRLDISSQLTKMGMFCNHSFFLWSVFLDILMRWEYERLFQFKNIHKGQRCFIIGNGPSLKTSDLELIKNEVSFATNEIFKIFSSVDWRPSYYVIHDSYFIMLNHKKIVESVDCPRFYAFNTVLDIEDFTMRSDYFYHSNGVANWFPADIRKPDFSEHPHILSWGGTITYDCIQLAAYMGFTEIYLLGMDHTAPLAIAPNGELIKSNTSNNFSSSYTQPVFLPSHSFMNATYLSAREYAENNGIEIINATRGGNLDVFKRVCFDNLF